MRQNKPIELLFFIGIPLFIIAVCGYFFHPYLIPFDTANEYNVKRFHKKQSLFEETISRAVESVEEFEKELVDTTLHWVDLDNKQRDRLKRIGIRDVDIYIRRKCDIRSIKAVFFTGKTWMNKVLKNVRIEYNTDRVNDYPLAPNEKSGIYSLRIGGGWFFEVGDLI